MISLTLFISNLLNLSKTSLVNETTECQSAVAEGYMKRKKERAMNE